LRQINLSQQNKVQDGVITFHKDGTMKLWIDLFTTDYGLMSIIGLAFIIGMGIFFLRMFLGLTKT
jgi:hypothetical protein